MWRQKHIERVSFSFFKGTSPNNSMLCAPCVGVGKSRIQGIPIWYKAMYILTTLCLAKAITHHELSFKVGHLLQFYQKRWGICHLFFKPNSYSLIIIWESLFWFWNIWLLAHQTVAKSLSSQSHFGTAILIRGKDSKLTSMSAFKHCDLGGKVLLFWKKTNPTLLFGSEQWVLHTLGSPWNVCIGKCPLTQARHDCSRTK